MAAEYTLQTKAIVDRLKREGELLRNKGAHSIRSIKQDMSKFDGVFQTISESILHQTDVLRSAVTSLDSLRTANRESDISNRSEELSNTISVNIADQATALRALSTAIEEQTESLKAAIIESNSSEDTQSDEQLDELEQKRKRKLDDLRFRLEQKKLKNDLRQEQNRGKEGKGLFGLLKGGIKKFFGGSFLKIALAASLLGPIAFGFIDEMTNGKATEVLNQFKELDFSVLKENMAEIALAAGGIAGLAYSLGSLGNTLSTLGTTITGLKLGTALTNLVSGLLGGGDGGRGRGGAGMSNIAKVLGKSSIGLLGVGAVAYHDKIGDFLRKNVGGMSDSEIENTPLNLTNIGVAAAGGAATGATIGSLFGPAGTLVGGLIGAAAGTAYGVINGVITKMERESAAERADPKAIPDELKRVMELAKNADGPPGVMKYSLEEAIEKTEEITQDLQKDIDKDIAKIENLKKHYKGGEIEYETYLQAVEELESDIAFKRRQLANTKGQLQKFEQQQDPSLVPKLEASPLLSEYNQNLPEKFDPSMAKMERWIATGPEFNMTPVTVVNNNYYSNNVKGGDTYNTSTVNAPAVLGMNDSNLGPVPG